MDLLVVDEEEDGMVVAMVVIQKEDARWCW